MLISNEFLLKQLVEGIIREEDVLYAVLLSYSGEVVAAAHSQQLAAIPPRTAPRESFQSVSWTDPLTHAYQILWGGVVIYEITYPIKTKQVRREREEIGLALDTALREGGLSGSERAIGLAAVGMSLSLKQVNQTIVSIFRSIALLTALVILAGVGVTVFLVKIIAGPVKQLAEATRQIAEGDLKFHVGIKSRDEIGELAASFNRMASSVEQRENELRAHADELDRLNRQLVHQQEELRQINSKLEAASRHKSQFLANMSHELRTPLNAILGFAGILANESLAPPGAAERKEFLTNIASSGKHLLGLINEVLDLSKIEAGKVEINLERFSVSEVLDGVRQIVEPMAANKRVDIQVGIDPKLETLTADVLKVKQILYNLLSNAIKFTPEGGNVRVRAAVVGDGAQFAVTDTGIGIRPEDRERIFQEFEQVEMSAERRFEGTGLGLTLAKKFVELQGGRIWLESEVGKGSTFTFSLPLRMELETAGYEEGRTKDA
jgi:signal transduction histidine kinase